MRNNKIRKIYEVINENGRGLNLHEIKAMTGIGNGYNSTTIDTIPVTTTGAGNGHKHSNIVDVINNISNDIAEACSHKSHKINEVLNNSRNLNLHEIKALTGAGSGYRQ